MMDPWLVTKVTLVFVGALAALRMAPRQSAAVRALLLTSAFVAALALPIASAVGPSYAVPVPMPATNAAPSAHVSASTAPPEVTLPVLITSVEVADAPLVAGTAWPTLLGLQAFWLAGFFAVLAPVAISLWRASGIRRRARVWVHIPMPVVEAVRASGLEGRVDIRVSDEIRVPMAFGIMRPVVLLPTSAEQWTVEQLTCAVTHELEHVRRKDLVAVAVARVTCAFYWFHPLVWFAWRRLRLEIERACDDAVVATGERVAYAEQLVQLARGLGGRSAMSSVAMASRTDLTARVTAVLDPLQSRARVGAGTFRGAILLVCVAVLVVAPLRVVGRGQEPKAADLEPRSAPVKGGGTVVGVVYDPTGVPLGGLLLVLERNCFGPGGKACEYGSWTRTDRLGHFRFEGLPAGSFHITSPIDFFPGTPFWIALGETIERDIVMKTEPVEAEFTICAACVDVTVPDSLAKEFEADRKDALDHPVSAPRPAAGWEFYKPGRGDYPPALREAGLEGSVVVEGVIGPDGAPIRMKAEPAGTPLARAAVATLADEIWEPGRVRGVAIEVPFRFLIRYTLKE